MQTLALQGQTCPENGEIEMFDFCDVDGLLIVDGEVYWTRLPSVALVTDCAAWRGSAHETEKIVR